MINIIVSDFLILMKINFPG